MAFILGDVRRGFGLIRLKAAIHRQRPLLLFGPIRAIYPVT